MGKENINEYRFFRVTEDVTLRGIPLKKGDILPITDWKLKNLAFSRQGMHFYDETYMFGNHRGVLDVIEYYPMDEKPFNFQEYIGMLPKKKIVRDGLAKIYLKPGQEIYLSEELLARIFLDDCHSGYDWSEMFYTHNPLSFDNSERLDYYKRDYSINLDLIPPETDSNLTIKLLNQLPTTNNGELQTLKSKLSVKLDPDFKAGQIPNGIKPGLYKVIGKKNMWETPYLTVYFNKGETIDFSKPEYASMLIQRDFLQFLDRSSEVTDLEEKKEVYSKWQEGVLENGTRYFRLKKGVDYDKFIYDEYRRMRKRIGESQPAIDAVEDSNGRVVLRVKPDSGDVLFTAVMDRELSEIGDKLPINEATHYQLKDASEKQKQDEESCKARAKEEGINYFSLKMKAELAERRAREYPEESDLWSKAYDYREEHKKRYRRYKDIIPELSVLGFYLMENAQEKNNKNKVVEQIYGQEKQALQASALSAFKQILNKQDEETSR